MAWFNTKKTEKNAFPWIPITSTKQLSLLIENNEKAILIFKHSTRCSISSAALSRFEREFKDFENCQLLFLDLIAYRTVSNDIVDLLRVQHESPQAILVVNKEVVYHDSHNGIRANEIETLL